MNVTFTNQFVQAQASGGGQPVLQQPQGHLRSSQGQVFLQAQGQHGPIFAQAPKQNQHAYAQASKQNQQVYTQAQGQAIIAPSQVRQISTNAQEQILFAQGLKNSIVFQSAEQSQLRYTPTQGYNQSVFQAQGHDPNQSVFVQTQGHDPKQPFFVQTQGHDPNQPVFVQTQGHDPKLPFFVHTQGHNPNQPVVVQTQGHNPNQPVFDQSQGYVGPIFDPSQRQYIQGQRNVDNDIAQNKNCYSQYSSLSQFQHISYLPNQHIAQDGGVFSEQAPIPGPEIVNTSYSNMLQSSTLQPYTSQSEDVTGKISEINSESSMADHNSHEVKGTGFLVSSSSNNSQYQIVYQNPDTVQSYPNLIQKNHDHLSHFISSSAVPSLTPSFLSVSHHASQLNVESNYTQGQVQTVPIQHHSANSYQPSEFSSHPVNKSGASTDNFQIRAELYSSAAIQNSSQQTSYNGALYPSNPSNAPAVGHKYHLEQGQSVPGAQCSSSGDLNPQTSLSFERTYSLPQYVPAQNSLVSAQVSTLPFSNPDPNTPRLQSYADINHPLPPSYTSNQPESSDTQQLSLTPPPSDTQVPVNQSVNDSQEDSEAYSAEESPGYQSEDSGPASEAPDEQNDNGTEVILQPSPQDVIEPSSPSSLGRAFEERSQSYFMSEHQEEHYSLASLARVPSKESDPVDADNANSIHANTGNDQVAAASNLQAPNTAQEFVSDNSQQSGSDNTPEIPIPSAVMDIPDLRQEFLNNQMLPLPGQCVVLPPLTEDRSIQTIQLLTPTQQGQFSVQTIVLPIMKLNQASSTPTLKPSYPSPVLPSPSSNPSPSVTLDTPVPASSQTNQFYPPTKPQLTVKAERDFSDPFVIRSDDDDVLLNQVDETGLPKVMQGIDLDRVKQFAAEFKSVRLSLGLTQTQVGLAMQPGEDGPVVSQSTICRFEKLEITALQVKRLLPILQSWLCNIKEKQSLGIPIDISSSHHISQDGQEIKRRKKRTIFSEETVSVLNQEFSSDQNPNLAKIIQIGAKVGLEKSTVRVWFSNRRQTERKLQQELEGGGGGLDLKQNYNRGKDDIFSPYNNTNSNN